MSDDSPRKSVPCAICGGPLLDWDGPGRLATYCSAKCRQKAYRQRQRTSPERLEAEIREVARRVEALVLPTRGCSDQLMGRFAAEALERCAAKLHQTAGVLNPDRLPGT